MTLHKLTVDQLAAEREHYQQQATDSAATDTERRVAEARLSEIAAEEARRRAHPNGHGTNGRNRWPQVSLADLIRESGCTLNESDGERLRGDHACKHDSKSGTCLVVWPAEGRYWCSSCREAGDAAGWLANTEGISYAEAAAKLEARFGPAPHNYDTLPWIDAEEQDLRVVTAAAWTAVVAANRPEPSLFAMGGQPVRLEEDADGNLAPVEWTSDRVVHSLARCANWYRTVRTGSGDSERTTRIIVRPPRYVVTDMLASPNLPLPALRRIVDVPVFAGDGTLQTDPGYHAASQTFYRPAQSFRLAGVPQSPTLDDVAAARGWLGELLCDFPFVSDADRAHAYALLILPFVRDLIDGPTPLHLIEAPTEGSGKGLLAEVCLLPGAGTRYGSMTAGRDAEEWRKSITSVLRAGHAVAWLDNVTRPIDSGDLASALTQRYWEDRLLGKSEMLRLPVRCVWLATANNPSVSREIMRRCVRIRLDPRDAEPWLRTGFRHTLPGWAREHRAELAWAALTLAQNWLAQGRPAPQSPTVGSYEEWRYVLGGILECAGVPGFLTNLADFYREASTEVAAWRAFVAAWWEKHRSEPVLARELLPLALDTDGIEVRGKDEQAQARSLGKLIAKQRDRVIGGFVIEHAGEERLGIRWRLRAVNTPTPDPSCGFSGFCGFPALTQNLCSEQEAEQGLAAKQALHKISTSTENPQNPQNPQNPEPTGLAATFVLIDTAEKAEAALAELMVAPALGFDTETTGLDPHADRLRLVTLATPECVYILDTARVDPAVWRPVLESGAVKIAHNAKFDLRFLLAHGLSVSNVFDTLLADQLLRGSRTPRKLAELADEYAGVTLDKTLQTSDWSAELSRAQIEYAARDAAVLLPIREKLLGKLEAAKLTRCAALENRAVPAIAWLEHNGVAFDAEAWRRLADDALAEKLRLEDELNALAQAALGNNNLFGRHVNWDAPEQVKTILRDLGLDVPNTAENTLAELADRHPIVAKLLAYREIAKRVGTYGLNVLADVHPKTGRIHADWRQIGAESGRMACTRPNLQNVPRTAAYRACFRAPAGRVLVKADYSQIELRIAAEIAADKAMIEAYQQGDDLHTLTARAILNKHDVSKEDRQLAKSANFGLLYGMGAAGFQQYAKTSYGVELTLERATALREAFFRAYPGLRQWHRRQPDGAIEARTIAGRRRLNVERFTEKLNTPVQGTGADGLKAALALLWETRRECPSAFPVLAVHDEIVIECDRAEAERAKTWLVDCMLTAMRSFLRRVPVEVEAAIIADWNGTPVAEQ